ncbi:MAG TPA: hypothetical protein VKU01_25925 [Bryobacteraceae bacterium]|nr:hypothetical protein [Bryobacteraceae bacterium]
MNPEQIPGAILLTLVCLVGALGMWYAGMRRNRTGLKQMAVMLGIAPFLGIGIQIASPLLNQIEYRRYADGPTRSQAVASQSITLSVTNPGARHELRMVPRIQGGNPPDRPIHMNYSVRTPKGQTVIEGQADLAPAPAEWTMLGRLWPTRFQPLRWKPLQAEFQPAEEGDYTLVLDIPQPVRSVDIFVRERLK